MIDNNFKILPPNSTIGILGGGQLGKMICLAAHNLGYKTVIFSNNKNSPAQFVTSKTIIADYLNNSALEQFANLIDVATLEFENIPVYTVDFIEKFKPVYPKSRILEITQNRIKEKDFLNKIKIKTTNYLEVRNKKDLKLGLEEFNYKAILKTTTLGYDGKGQRLFQEQENIDKIWPEFEGKELILEEFANFNQEISVIIARNIKGEIACYEPLTNIHKNGILDKSFYPARINKEIANNAKDIAQIIATNLNLIGILAVELFVLENSQLLVNEMAPRPHNSGHFSIDASYSSQFEQLIRTITSMDLGITDFHSVGFMQNLIGKDILMAQQLIKNKNAKLHIYGKDKIVPGRKMGHINFLENKHQTTSYTISTK